MTYQELVKKVQTALKKADASAVAEHIAAQVNVTGDAEGAFYIEIKDGTIKAEPFDYNDRDFLLIADGADVLEFVQGKIKLEAATVAGKIAHEGDWEKALTLDSVLPTKKTAAKKTKAKTEEAVPEVKEDVKVDPAPETVSEEVKEEIKADPAPESVTKEEVTADSAPEKQLSLTEETDVKADPVKEEKTAAKSAKTASKKTEPTTKNVTKGKATKKNAKKK